MVDNPHWVAYIQRLRYFGTAFLLLSIFSSSLCFVALIFQFLKSSTLLGASGVICAVTAKGFFYHAECVIEKTSAFLNVTEVEACRLEIPSEEAHNHNEHAYREAVRHRAIPETWTYYT